LDIENLRYFISVAQLLNFSEAARQNNVPQPKISRSIVELETQLNAKLLFRTNRDVSLTREGETFLPYAIDLVDLAAKAADMVDQFTGADGLSLHSYRFYHQPHSGIVSVDILHAISRYHD
jgi:DNA-binding transcriptional LysR family regulator